MKSMHENAIVMDKPKQLERRRERERARRAEKTAVEREIRQRPLYWVCISPSSGSPHNDIAFF